MGILTKGVAGERILSGKAALKKKPGGNNGIQMNSEEEVLLVKRDVAKERSTRMKRKVEKRKGGG